MQILIEKIVYQGLGLTRQAQGKVIFTPFVIPGETVEVEVSKKGKNFLTAELKEILSPAPERITPKCSYYTKCGGCQYQHIEYNRQLEIKEEQIKETLERIGRLPNASAIVTPLIPSPKPYFYRNKAVLQAFPRAGRNCLGYYDNQNQLMEIKNCPLLADELNNELAVMPERLEPDFQGAVILRTDGQKVYWQKGSESETNPLVIETDILGNKLKFSAAGFFQVNYHILPHLIEAVREAAELTGQETVIDAYCGTGLFGIFLGAYAKKVIGIEQNQEAVNLAQENAQMNSCTNIEFLAGEVEKVMPTLAKKFDLMLIDPPRTGASPELLKEIFKWAPAKLLYISCDPVTLARDLRILQTERYQLSKLQPLDMFPQTYHIESLAVLNAF